MEYISWTLLPHPILPHPSLMIKIVMFLPCLITRGWMQLNFLFQFARLCGKVVKLCQVMSNCPSRFPSFPTFWRLAERLSWEQPTGYVLRPAWVWSLVWLSLMEDTWVKCGQLLQLFMREGMKVYQLWDLDKEHEDKQWDLGPPYFQTNLNHPCRTLQEKNNKWKMINSSEKPWHVFGCRIGHVSHFQIFQVTFKHTFNETMISHQ